ncbi:MAG: polysaccharide deacetylase [Lachnospiraceae bacterium]|nr:polysaccharide deacetylase [Lachnospiraceae bacterium]
MPQYYRYSEDRSRSLNQKKKRRKVWRNRILAALAGLAMVVGLFFGVRTAYRGIRGWVNSVMGETETQENTQPGQSAEAGTQETAPEETENNAKMHEAELAEASRLAASYDYDGAVAYIQSLPGYADEPALMQAIQDYLNLKTTLVKADITQVYHVFFHSLVVDTELAFYKAPQSEIDGYNQVMTTVDEFNAMLQQMYDRGFVLVKLHDMAYKDADGKLVKGSIMLPEGKKPFVLSVDDVSYYAYMTGDGFASKIVLDENNFPTCEMVQRDGSVTTGDFDVVPILEKFVEQHPDFSYKGAKGCLALTGYEGIMGYRTAPKYGDPSNSEYKPEYASLNWEEEKAGAAKVAARLKELGWEFASHSWGHVNMTNADLDWISTDMRKWMEQVDPLLGGGTDIMIFAFGADIGSWRNYTEENEKFVYLKSLGFTYFCNVDAYNIPWVQFNSTQGYLRQGRVNLDGYEMYYRADKLEVFFDVETVFDKSRPLPVPKY